MNRTAWFSTICAALVACAGPSGARPSKSATAGTVPGDLAVEWNALLLSIAESEDRFLTLRGVRAAAMMHLAMHDALNTIDPRYERYAYSEASSEASPRLAAARAAYAVTLHEYPTHAARLGRAWKEALGDGGDGAVDASVKDAVVLGERAAAAVLAQRAADGWNTEASYTWHPMAPGVYAEFHEHSGTPKGFVFGAGWAKARPFMLTRQDQFRSPPPPAIDSADYTRAFEEVKKVGRFRSAARTSDQTHLALWWKDFVENSHNRLARKLITRDRQDLWRASRLFALLNMSIYDAYVSVFDNKFHYNHWRPYTAIRWAEHDGNPDTEADPSWTNTHQHTYAFPSYPSAHGCACAAAMTVLADTFGDETSFTMDTPFVDRAGPLSEKVPMNPPSRTFARFSEAAMECALSRVYLGIHFRYDSTRGHELGNKIGVYASHTFLRPRKR